MEDKFKSIILSCNQTASSRNQYYIYIVTNYHNTVLYVGVTSNLIKRIYEHKNKLVKGFTNTYNCNKLVYFEIFSDIQEAIKREKYIKGKKRNFKIDLIQSLNPNWRACIKFCVNCLISVFHLKSI